MAYVFSKESPVLYFKPRAHVNPGGRNEREYILWPAWAYRVVAPEVRDRKINVLEKAVLGLCRAGVTIAQEIALKIHIHPDLAVHIMLGLRQNGFIGYGGLPTQKGIDVLQEETLEDHKLITGYFFQDPWELSLWPRFVEKLDYADLEFTDNGFPHLVFGSTGKPWYQRAYMQFPERNADPREPGATEILRRTCQHRRDLRNASSFQQWEEEFLDDMGSVPLERISIVDEHPEPVFLTTYLYLPKDGTDIDWYVCDPFGLGHSPFLRRLIEKRIDQYKEKQVQQYRGLFKAVNRLIGNSLHTDFKDYNETLEKLRGDAVLTVENNLSSKIRSHKKAYKNLTDMEYSLKKAGERCSGQEVRAIMTEARITLEALFGDIKESYPTNGVWKKLYVNGKPNSDREFIRELLNRAADKIGFQTPIPSAIANVKPGQIKSVADYDDNWRLRPAVIAAILAASEQPEHPLYAAAKTEALLLEQIEEIIKAAGESVHAGDGKLEIASVQEMVDKVYGMVKLLLGF